MNSDTKTALGIGALIVLVAGGGTGLFLLTEVSGFIWATIIGVPLVVILGVGLYVRGVVNRGNTSQQQFIQQKGQSTAAKFQDLIREYRELQSQYPRWSPQFETRLEAISGDFRSCGIVFDLDDGSYNITGMQNTDAYQLDQLESDVSSLHDEVESDFIGFAESELQDIEQQIDRLNEIELTSETPSVQTPAGDSSLAAYQDQLDATYDIIDQQIDDAIDTIDEVLRSDTAQVNTRQVESDLDAAIDAVERHAYEDAVSALFDARETLEMQMSDSIQSERQHILDLVDSALDSDIDRYVSQEKFDTLEEKRRDAENINSALAIGQVYRHKSQVREISLDIISTAERELSDALQTLRGADLPPGYYNEPSIASTDVAGDLRTIDDFTRYTDQWRRYATELTDALETLATKASIVDSYSKLAETIEDKLQRHGEVRGDDLPVRNADEVLGLYYRRNSDTEFDPDGPVLRQGDLEEYDVNVDVVYEQGGEMRVATVELNRHSETRQQTVETRVRGSVSFADVPEGTYQLHADPGTTKFAPIDREVAVDSDRSLSVEFESVPLHERVCSDVDVDMTAHLNNLDDELTSTFDDEGYLSTQMDLPVKSSYASCLLALWADQEGYDAAKTDDGVIVFVQRDIRQELENMIRYNLDRGDSLAFDDARRNFLSAPVPDAVIRELVAELADNHNVTTRNQSIVKE